jgi:hypothetical protein
MTTDGRYFYVVGSQSKRFGFDGDGLVRFTFDAAQRRVENVQVVRSLKAFLAEHVAELKGTASKLGDDVLNIEGLAWDPEGRRLLLGLRAPVVDGQALVVPVRMRDRAAPFTAGNLQVDANKAIRVPLGGAGIRSLEYNAASKHFDLIAGAALDAEVLDFRLLDWNGPSAPARVREVATFSKRTKPEGLTRARLAGRDITFIVFDTSGYLMME